MNLDSAIRHRFNGQYYIYRYIFTGYEQPEMSDGASEDATWISNAAHLVRQQFLL
jgi:hypothetical protein